MSKDRFNLRKMIALGIFCAVAYVVTFVFHVKIGFLTFDLKDSVVCIASMLFGPLSGIAVAAVTATLELITVSETGLWGWLMNFASTACFAAIAGMIYHYYRNLAGAVAGLVVSIAASVSLMLVLNILITPIYMKTTTAEVMNMIPKLLLPFNAVKYLNSAALVLLFYKPLSNLMKTVKVRERVLGEEEHAYRFGLKSIIVMASALVLCGVCMFIVFRFLGGSVSFF